MEKAALENLSADSNHISSALPNALALELGGRWRVGAWILATVYIGVIAFIARETGAFYVLVPILGALSYDVTGRPRGRWASAPVALAILPPLGGVIGIAICKLLPYGLLSVLLTVAGVLAVLLALDSPIAPAIAAGLLPLVLGLKTWWYPPALALGCLLLAALLVSWKRLSLPGDAAETPAGAEQAGDSPWLWYWLPVLAGFLAAAVGAVYLTGMRFLLFPPLAVIGCEMFRHPHSCPWATRPLRIPPACFLAAAGGLLSYDLLGVGVLAAMLSMAWAIAVLRALKLDLPPATAVALLPMVMTAPTARYPLAVALGTGLLALWFLAYRRVIATEAA